MRKIHSFDEVFDAQKMFRLLLEVMSNPTRTVSIKKFSDKLYGDTPEFLAIAMTLLDNEVSFQACENHTLSEQIISLTLSREEPFENADFIFVTDPSMLQDVIKNAKCGTLRDPHRSATIIVKNTANAKNNCLRLYGAGINGTAEFKTSDIVKTAIDIRDHQYYEYPQGVDFIFVSENGDLFAIPRLTLKEVV